LRLPRWCGHCRSSRSFFCGGAIDGGLNPGQSKTINAYANGDMIAYSLLVMLGRGFSSMPRVDHRDCRVPRMSVLVIA
jgi:hypothetical protein